MAGEAVFNFATIASANSWTNGTAYTTVTVSPVTLTANGGGNNGKYYTSNSSWRMYNGGSLSITVAEGKVTEVSSTPAYDFAISEGVATASFTATVQFTQITVTYKLDSDPDVPATAIALNKSTLTLEQYREETLVQTVTPSNATTAITWESSDPTVATVAGGLVKAVGVGTATITVKAGESVSATCDVTVNEATVLTCAQAVTMAKTLANNNDVYAGGQYVVEGYAISMSASYPELIWLADSEDAAEGEFEVYRPSNKSEIANVTKGDRIRAYGYITKYNDTYEFAQGCTFEVVVAPGEVAKPVFTPAAGTYNAAQNVTIACETEGASIYYTLDGTEPTASSTKYTAAIVLDSDGTHTIKAVAILGAKPSEIVTAEYKIMTPKTFASLEALIAANLETEWPVTVSFADVMISDVYTNSAGFRKGLYVDVQKDDEDIEIYYNNGDVVVPDAWGQGGLISGTIEGKWTFYDKDDQWELVPTTANWNWTSLTYVAPTVETPRVAPLAETFFEEVEVTLTCATEGATIYYILAASGEPNIEYTAPIKLTETTVIRAIAVKGTDNSEVVYRKFTLGRTLTCADAKTAALSVSANNELYNEGEVLSVKGYVTKIDSELSGGLMTFWIDDAKGTTETLQVYKCSIADAKDAPVVGDFVRIIGKLTKYNSKPQFSQKSTCVILEKVPTAIDNNVVEGKAVKRIENGMLIIEKNGVRYNALGQAIR